MKLKSYLSKNKITPEVFAERLGIQTKSVYRYLHGRVPTPPVCASIYALTGGKVDPNSFHVLAK